ncbi:uncharacterized protein LOC143884239 [Tasmannia lanceolata]|uniref:uncharacterized protein LOC143884239 n=1 Tax=Tasmannia lanceolata TaxID=3420 RepID=UPI0040644BEA
MDESWPFRIGSKLPRRRSTEQTASDFIRKNCFDLQNSESETLDPEDFKDVFGGPPRSVILRQHSGDFSGCFYEEIFRTPEFKVPARKGRNLPSFQIPAPARGDNRLREGFYEDIFGSGEDRRSRSRSKSNSSSVLSSEDLSPLRPSIADDSGFISFGSKLRPIVIPSRQSAKSTFSREQSRQMSSNFTQSTRPSYMEFQFTEPGSHFGSSSPETINIGPGSYLSIKRSVDDLDLDSSFSEISSLDGRARIQEKASREQEEEEQEEAELLSSYVIEISSERKEEKEEAVAIDEAIAWAKETWI